MAGPSEAPKNEIRCKGKLKTGKKKGNPCRGLLVAEDGTIACHNCGDSRHLLDVLGDAVKQGIITKEAVMAAIRVAELNQKENEEKKMGKEKTLVQNWAEKKLAEFRLGTFVGFSEDQLKNVIETGSIKELLQRIPMVAGRSLKNFGIRELSLNQLKKEYSPAYIALYNRNKAGEVIAYVIFLNLGANGLRGAMYNAEEVFEGEFMISSLSRIKRIYITSPGPDSLEALIIEEAKNHYMVIYIKPELPEGKRMGNAFFGFKDKYIKYFFV